MLWAFRARRRVRDACHACIAVARARRRFRARRARDASFVGASVVLESRPRVRHLRLVRRGRRRAHDDLLTAYELDAAPPLRATPLRLVPSNGAAGAGLGARLWRETRLVRGFAPRPTIRRPRPLRVPPRPSKPAPSSSSPRPRARRRRGAPRRPPGPATDALERAVSPDAVVGEDDDVAVTPEDDGGATRAYSARRSTHTPSPSPRTSSKSPARARAASSSPHAPASPSTAETRPRRERSNSRSASPRRPLPRSPPSSLPAAPSHLPPRPRVVIRVSHESARERFGS